MKPEYEIHGCRVRLIASDQNWIEGEAVRQLDQTAGLAGMRLAVGLPDLHPGKGGPVGVALLSRERFYPLLIGNDIGCGMGLWLTDIERRKLKLDRLAERLDGLESLWPGDPAAWLEAQGHASNALATNEHNGRLGTIGGGNHFAELQVVERIEDTDQATQIGLEPDRAVLLVHSGSRGLGEAILREHTGRFGARGIDEGEDAAADYLTRHDEAVGWARANRALIAQRFMEQARAEGRSVLDLSHNSLTRRNLAGEPHWLHRKGAAPADEGLTIIPGSRGTFSYLAQPLNPGEPSAWSLAHGAGRKWNRGQCESRLRGKFHAADLERTQLGGRVICEDRELLYEEAPQAYKDVAQVVEDLKEAGLIRIVAVLRPVLTYKTRRRA